MSANAQASRLAELTQTWVRGACAERHSLLFSSLSVIREGRAAQRRRVKPLLCDVKLKRRWFPADLRARYTEEASEKLAQRVRDVLAWAESNGRLIVGRTLTPAFGILGNNGKRVLSIRELGGGSPLQGRISLFPSPDRYRSDEEARDLKDLLLRIANSPERSDNPGSWDATYLSVLSEEHYAEFFEILEWIGPAPASDAAVDLPVRADVTISRIVRDSELVRRLKLLHDNTCQICGERLIGTFGWSYAEAHHIKPLARNGPDSAENILIVCPNHHAACDFGAIVLDCESLRSADGHAISRAFVEFHNQHARSE